METIVINRKLIPGEEKGVLDLLKENNQSILFSNVDLPPALQQYSKGEIDLTTEEKIEINYNIITTIIQFGEIEINNKAITDMLTFEKVSIWHYHKFRIYFSIRNLFYEIELIKKLRSEYDKVYYYGDNRFLKEFPFESTGIQINIIQFTKAKFSKKIAFNYAIFFLIRSLQGVFKAGKLKKKKHIVIDHSIKQTCLNLYTLKPEPGNYNLQYLFEKLDDPFIILNDVEIPKFITGVEFSLDASLFKSNGKTFFGEWVLLCGLTSGKVRKELKKVTAGYFSKYKEIESSLNDPVNKLVIQSLKSLHASSKLFLFKYLAYKKFFAGHSFKSISSIDENSPRIKSILDAAKSNNIATIGIQHGTIHELHPAYIYSKEDQRRNTVPDYTMVWGKYWSQFLIDKGNYKPESLEITGQIRTDIIQKLTNVKAKDYLEIPEGSRIVVFASQPQRDPKLREQAAYDVFSSVKSLKNVHLIIKLHPAEKNDIDYYKKIAEKAECLNYQIILNIDLYLLISLCDILITCFSTVGAETVYFNKPLIILDHLKQDIQSYHKEGIAFQAQNSAELKTYLEKLLSGEINFSNTAYKNYIEKYANKIDGKVADRIIDFIRNL
jgi:hypothetical protein